MFIKDGPLITIPLLDLLLVLVSLAIIIYIIIHCPLLRVRKSPPINSTQQVSEKTDKIPSYKDEIINELKKYLRSEISEKIDKVATSLEYLRSEISEKIDKIPSYKDEIINELKKYLRSEISEKIDKVATSLEYLRSEISEKIDKIPSYKDEIINELKSIASKKLDKLIEEINHVKGRLTEVCSKTVEKTYEEVLKEITRHLYLDTIKKNFIINFEYLVKHNIIDEQFTCNKVEQKFSEIFPKSKIESIHTDDFLDYIAFIAIVEKCGFKQKIDEIKEKIEEEISKSIIEIIKRDRGAQKLINEICKEGM
ncbi:MAG: hypothetical protein QXI77_01130 [Nanopusillaceae archaeon]